MYEDLKGKTALVTGAGKKTGIGYAIAERLGSCGCNVVIADLGRPPKLTSPVPTGTREEMETIAADLGKRFGVNAFAAETDVTDSASVAAMAERLRSRCGHVHILVNNAGASFGVPADILTYDEAAWIRTVDVNLLSVFRVSRAILPLMFGQPGVIVNTASRAGKVPPLFNSAYAVAKAGVIMLTKTMARELAGHRIRVNAICPGHIRTEREVAMTDKAPAGTQAWYKELTTPVIYALRRAGRPEEVAQACLFLASEASSFVTGASLAVDGGLTIINAETLAMPLGELFRETFAKKWGVNPQQGSDA